MTNSLMKWHLARDDFVKLAKFCEKHKVRNETELYAYSDGENNYFHITYLFDNGGFIKAELLQGTKDKGYSVADWFSVVDYGWGSK